MTQREADARPEVEEFKAQTQNQATIYRDVNTGAELDPGDVAAIVDPTTKKRTTFHPPLLSPEEQAQAAAALKGALEAHQVRYPTLAGQLLRSPEQLWILGEIQMMLSPEENEVSYDITADLMEGLTTTTAQRTEYEYRTAHEETQQMFWEEIGKVYGPEEREFMVMSLAQLTPESANAVGGLALAWKDSGHDMNNEEDRGQLFLNILNWSAQQQEYDRGQEGIFGLLDYFQEGVERNVVAPLINAGVGLLSGPEEAARRRGLTPGQQLAYQFGIRPPEEAGGFGWWNLVSGIADAQIELGADPLNWLAGLGAGQAAIKTIPVAAKATTAGKFLAAARSLLPKPFAGVGRAATGGRVARVVYSLGAKTMDELLVNTLKTGVAEEAFTLLKGGDVSKFQRLFPAWKGLSDNAIRVIQNSVESPEEFIEILKADALQEVLRGGEKLEELTANAHRSREAMRGAGSAEQGRRFRNGIARTSGQSALYKDQVRTLIEGGKLEPEAAERAKAGLRWWDETAEETADLVRTANQLEVDEFTKLKKGDEFVIPFANAEPKGAGFADQAASREGSTGWTIEFGDTTRAAENDLNQIPLASGEVEQELFVSGRFKVTDMDNTTKTLKVEQVGDVIPDELTSRSLVDMLGDESIPRELRLQAGKDQLKLAAHNMESGGYFILSEVPTRSKRIFSWDKALERTSGTGRLSQGVRRTIARVTPGRIPDSIHLFNVREGIGDLRRLGEHFGLNQSVIDNLVMDFEHLESGARQDWVIDTFIPAIGRETGVPAFEHQLVQFYKGSGIRNFSASGVDLLSEGKRIIMLPTQVSESLPIPVDIMNQVFRRAKSIGERSKLARAIGFNGRGLGKTTGRRMELVNRIRHQLGETAKGMSDDQLYDMAFSLVSPNAGLDARGVWAGKMMPAAGSVFSHLHQWFTKSMLVFRPIQWMWRVALLEEPIRAHIFNLPSLYSNPLQYMGKMREAHYLWNMEKWVEANMSWGQDIMAVLAKGGRKNMIDTVESFGLSAEVFAEGIPRSTRGVRSAIEHYVENALYGRTRINKLDPIKRVPWTVKNRAHSISVAERALKKNNLPDAFDFHEAAKPIAGRLVAGYLGEAVGASERKLYQWTTGLKEDEAFTHGRVWGARMIQFVEDPYGRMALRRRSAILRGATPDITGQQVVNSSRWEIMAPDLRLKYPTITDDVELAEKYMDDMLATEIDHIFQPFKGSLNKQDYGNLLDEFATSRRITGDIGGQALDWDLRSSNYGGGVRQVGDFTASVRHDATVRIPSDLPTPSLDGRFMAEDDPKWPSRMSNWVLQTFGEDATQTINRRPAWLGTYNRWYTHYRKLDISEEHATRLAIDHANKMVNHVFFNMDEAPYYVAKLNKYLPFFGATYEVMAEWTYKMPVAVGGSWPMGVGEFARKFDRLMDTFVNIGLVDLTEEEDGSHTYTLNLVPEESEMASTQEVGRWLQGAGYHAIHTIDEVFSTLFGLEEGLKLREQGYHLAAGHPLNPQDYGILSFAQADIGLNPATNIAVSTLASMIPGASGPRQMVAQPEETLAAFADRMNVDVTTLARYNREVFIDTKDFGSTQLYNDILGGKVDPTQVVMPNNTVLNVPGSSTWDAFTDWFMPFGEISSAHELAANFLPSTLRWVLAGLALQNQPSDEFWKGDADRGIFGGILPNVNQAQMASQLNEAFMYLEAHDVVDGKGAFTRIQEKEAEIARLLNEGKEAEAQALREETDIDTQAFLDRAQKVAAESLIGRGLTGQMLPTTPGHVRLEEETIRAYWDTKDYADSIRAGEGVVRLRNFKSMEDYENYKEQLAAWLADPKADRARATFYQNNPQLMAYLTPKTFYKSVVPDIHSFEEYQRQIESGEREPSPLHVTMWRARSAAIQADYYNKYLAAFGNDPVEAAAIALQNRSAYDELRDEKNLAYQGLEMWDDMHGGVYDSWRKDNYQDTETWAHDQIVDKLNAVRDNLQILFELEDNFDIELDLDGVANLNSTVHGAIAEISKALREYDSLTEETGNRNAYEEAINQYFEQVYVPYAEKIAKLYDKIPEVADSERQSLIYEQIKFIKNEYAGSYAYLPGSDVPFPNPLEYSWQGKDEEERAVKMQQWVTRPVEWMDQDQSIRILEHAPQLQGYLPSSDAEFDIYRQYTLAKVQVDEAFEANEITRSQRNKIIKGYTEELRRRLTEQGRGKEVEMMDMVPYEKLELAGMLPYEIENMSIGNGILGDAVRWYNQALTSAEESAGSVKGRQMTAPLYDAVEAAFYSDPAMRKALQDLGINLQDKTAMDVFLPWLFFNYTGER